MSMFGGFGGAALGGALGLGGALIGGGGTKQKYNAADARGQLAGGYRFRRDGQETQGIAPFVEGLGIEEMFGFNPFYENTGKKPSTTSNLSGTEQQRYFALQQAGRGIQDLESLFPMFSQLANQRLAGMQGGGTDALAALERNYNTGLDRLDQDTERIRQNFNSARGSVEAKSAADIKNQSAALARQYASRGFGTTTGLMNDVTNQVLPNVLGAKLGALANIENAQAGQLSNLAALRAQLSQQNAGDVSRQRLGLLTDRTPELYFSSLLDLAQQPTRLRQNLAQPSAIFGQVPTKIGVAGGNPNAGSAFAQNAGNMLSSFGGQLAGYGLLKGLFE